MSRERLSEAELLEEALVAPRRAIVSMPDTVIDERPGWFSILTPSLKQGGLNEVSGAQLEESEADGVIDAAIARYREHGVRFRWTVTPGSRPEDLAARLAQRGLRETTSRVVWRTTAMAPREEGAIEVEEIDERGSDELAHVIARGWGIDPAPLAAHHRRCMAQPGRRQRFFLARRNGEAAGGAAYVALDRSAYLVGASSCGSIAARASIARSWKPGSPMRRRAASASRRASRWRRRRRRSSRGWGSRRSAACPRSRTTRFGASDETSPAATYTS